MPPEASESAGLRALLNALAERIPLPIDSREGDALMRYLALLQRWNKTYNLTSVREPAQMLIQHLIDCMVIVPALRRHCGDRRQRVLDVGSGAGLPGVVIAALNPTFDVTCVDSVNKKAAFVQQVAAELGLRNLHAQHARVEQLRIAPFQIIACRAFSSLSDFVSLTRSQLAPDGSWMAMKGRHPTAELADLPADVIVFHVEQLTVPELDAERCLVWMRASL